MKKCRVTIITAVDGQENTIVREGEMQLSTASAILIYREENAATRIYLEGEKANIERIGDYCFHFNMT